MHAVISSRNPATDRSTAAPDSIAEPTTSNQPEVAASPARPQSRCISLGARSDAPLPIAVREVSSELRQWKLTPEGLIEVDATMGAFLDKPKTNKINFTGEGKGIRYAVSNMQGWRVDMEDSHVVEISMADKKPFKDWAFFAVFDGHAGSVAAEQSAEHILKTLLETEEFIEVCTLLEADDSLSPKVIELLEKGMKTGFMALDKIIRALLAARDSDRSGTTAVCAIITPTHIIIANLGDSRAVYSCAGEVSFSTQDHKPHLEKERERIVGAGGSVLIQRINGALAVSRALGDFTYKAVPGLCPTKQIVSCEPDIYCLERKLDEEQFLVLACDGIYDVMKNSELCQFVGSRLLVSDKLDEVCDQVLDNCLCKGSRDNLTIILVCFPNAPKVNLELKESEEKWVAKIKEAIDDILQHQDNYNVEEGDLISVPWIQRKLEARDDIGANPNFAYRMLSIIDLYLTEKNVPHET